MDLGDRKRVENLLFEATDRILYAHRNLKLLIFLTSGPFFVGFFALKYAIKLAVIYFVYSKTNSGKKHGHGKRSVTSRITTTAANQ